MEQLQRLLEIQYMGETRSGAKVLLGLKLLSLMSCVPLAKQAPSSVT